MNPLLGQHTFYMTKDIYTLSWEEIQNEINCIIIDHMLESVNWTKRQLKYSQSYLLFFPL